MAESEHLRKIISENPIASKSAKKHEAGIRNLIPSVIRRLEKKYPSYDFVHETTLYKREIAVKLSSVLNIELIRPYKHKSHIKPDLGFFYLIINGLRHLVLSGEAKRQGTNNRREKEGKPAQSRGNACERVTKNVLELQNYLIDESIFPYVVFFTGEDFENTSIRDRVSSMTRGGQIDEILLDNLLPETKNVQRASLFMQDKPFSQKKILDVLSSIADRAVEYYLRKYM